MSLKTRFNNIYDSLLFETRESAMKILAKEFPTAKRTVVIKPNGDTYVSIVEDDAKLDVRINPGPTPISFLEA